MSDHPAELGKLPPDLEAWGWRLQQMKAGPRKHPGGWYEVIFWRRHGLAKGDESLDRQDESLRVKVRRSTPEEAFAEAILQMRQVSASLEKSESYRQGMEADRRMMEQHLRIVTESRRHLHGKESGSDHDQAPVTPDD